MASFADVIATSEAAFGTSGVRGLVEELTDAACFAYTCAFLAHMETSYALPKNSAVWLGHDRRPSSPQIAAACIAAIEHCGHKPVFCGEIATPSVAFSALQDGAPAIIVTGSHIPFDRNGIKFHRADGELMKSDEQPIIEYAKDFPEDLFNGATLAFKHELPQPSRQAHDAYHHRAVSAFDSVLNGMRVGHFQHSAAGRDDLANLLQALGAEVVPLGRSEQFVPIDTEAVADADMAQAKLWARELNLDALMSTDGDGDRPLLGDETGRYLRGDTLGILAAQALGADCVVTPVSSNTALEKSGLFGRTIRTKIGSPHVIAGMNEAVTEAQGAVVGFEANGGFLTATPVRSPWNDATLAPLPTRDAVLPVLAVIALARKAGVPLSQVADHLPQRITCSDRFADTPREHSLRLIESLQETPDQTSALALNNQVLISTDDTDGLRMTFQDESVVHLRPSGNAPELRIYVENDSDASANDLLMHAKSTIAALLGD
ncbi:MAG: phosphomannomutase [Pseudomonadota bacterium]